MAQEPVIRIQPEVSATQRLNLAQVRRASSAGDACVALRDVAIAQTGDDDPGSSTSYTSLR
jgi:hypothetical protein